MQPEIRPRLERRVSRYTPVRSENSHAASPFSKVEPIHNNLVLRFDLASESEKKVLFLHEEVDVEQVPLEENTILPRLPNWKQVSSEEQKEDVLFQEMAKHVPGQKTTKHEPFPPRGKVAAPNEVEELLPLEVIKCTPEGELNEIPEFLQITFSQSMVVFPIAQVISQQKDKEHFLDIESTPVSLTPETDGIWKWVSETVLQFQPKEPFTMATTFTLIIPKGIKSFMGGTLVAPSFSIFSTPPVSLVSHFPSSGSAIHSKTDPIADPNTICVLQFNQVVKAESILSFVEMTVTTGGNEQKLTQEHFDLIDNYDFTEMEFDPMMLNVSLIETQKLLRSEAEIGKWVIFKNKHPLPKDSKVLVSILAGVPSLQGTNVSENPQNFSFRTYGALKLLAIDNRLVKGKTHDVYSAPVITVKFSNPIDVSSFQTSFIRITPTNLIAVEPQPTGDLHLILHRRTPFRTECELEFLTEIRDIFGQTLAHAESITLRGRWSGVITSPLSGLHVLNPAHPLRYPFSTNFFEVEVTISHVHPSNYNSENLLAWRGTVVQTEVMKIKVNEFQEPKETVLDLQEYLQFPKQNLGHLVVEIEPTMAACSHHINYARRPKLVSWLQCTNLDLVAFEGRCAPYVWTTSLQDGKSLKKTHLNWGNWTSNESWLISFGLVTPTLTGKDGVVQVPIPALAGENPCYTLIARQGDDMSFLPEIQILPGLYEGGYSVFCIHNKTSYYPCEEVKFRAWVRQIRTKGGHIEKLEFPLEDIWVNYDVMMQGQSIFSGKAQCKRYGAVYSSFVLPDSVCAGTVDIAISIAQKVIYVHQISVNHRKQPAFSVHLTTNEATHLLGSRLTCVAQVNYRDGSNYPDGPIQWSATAKPTKYTPPGWADFLFDPTLASQRFHWEDEATWRPPEIKFDSQTVNFQGQTDVLGTHSICLDFTGTLSIPICVTSSITVTPIHAACEQHTESFDILVHPAQVYVGVRLKNYLLQAGDTLAVYIIVCDIEGQLLQNIPLVIEISYIDDEGQSFSKGTFAQRSSNDPKLWEYTDIEQGGEWVVRVCAMDQQCSFLVAEASARLWVIPSHSVLQKFRGIKLPLQQLVLLPDKKQYVVGETAKIMVQSPFNGSYSGIMQICTSHHDQVIQRYDRTKDTILLDVRITETMIPNAVITVIEVGTQKTGQDEIRPVYSHGMVTLSVPPVRKTLNIDVRPLSHDVRPGELLKFDIHVTDSTGARIEKADLAVLIVNEDDQTEIRPPLSNLFPAYESDNPPKYLRSLCVVGDYLDKYKTERENTDQKEPKAIVHPLVQPKDFKLLKKKKTTFSGIKTADKQHEERNNGILIRENWNTTAAFIDSLRTDQEGYAQFEVRVPHSIANWRYQFSLLEHGKNLILELVKQIFLLLYLLL